MNTTYTECNNCIYMIILLILSKDTLKRIRFLTLIKIDNPLSYAPHHHTINKTVTKRQWLTYRTSSQVKSVIVWGVQYPSPEVVLTEVKCEVDVHSSRWTSILVDRYLRPQGCIESPNY